MWQLPTHLCLLSLAILGNAQHNGVPPAQPPKIGMSGPSTGPGTDRPAPAGPNFKDVATEKLLLRPLADGKVSAHFEFDYVNRQGVPRDPRTLGSEDNAQHYEFFPLSLGQILREYAVAEMHLTLNSGRWQYDTWGYPENPAVGTGAELWAWMAEGGPLSVEERWVGLSNALAGIFCASLSSLPQSRTTSPLYGFSPEGQLPHYPIEPSPVPPILGTPPSQNTTAGLDYKLYHAILPSENICTENLTPFVKVLPCKNYAGVAELLNPHKLFGGAWYGIGVHATWHDGSRFEQESLEAPVAMAKMGSKARPGKYQEDESEPAAPVKGSWLDPLTQKQDEKPGIKLKLTVGAVLDSDPYNLRTKRDEAKWSLESVFGKNITKLCAVTNRADVRVLAPIDGVTTSEETKKDSVPSWKAESEPSPGGARRIDGVWAVKDEIEGYLQSPNLAISAETWSVFKVTNTGLNLTISEQGLKHRPRIATSNATPLSMTRSLRGSDQTRGGFTITITNRLSTEVHAWYLDSVPWILRPYLSSLRIEDVQALDIPSTSDTQHILGGQTEQSFDPSTILDFENVNYVPPSTLPTTKDSRTMPTLLEIPLRLPARSIVRMSFEFEKVFLKYTEHPPDAQRGWDLPGGVLIPVESHIPGEPLHGEGKDTSATARSPRMYAAPLLADLATPDFSMPYNVIILSGALIALLFGMVFNMLMRRFVLIKT